MNGRMGIAVIVVAGIIASISLAFLLAGNNAPPPQAPRIERPPVVDNYFEPPPPPKKPGLLVVTPEALSFLAGTDGAAERQGVTIRNAGEEAIRISVLRLVGSSDLQIDHDCPNSLGGGSGCVATVAFRPHSLAEARGELLVVAGDKSASVQVSGTVRAPPPPPAPVAVPIDIEAQIRAELQRRRALGNQPGQAGGMASDDDEDIQVSRHTYSLRRREEMPPAISQRGYGATYPSTRSSLPVDRTRIVTTDSFISAVLITGINSALPGRINAQVEQDVYGAAGRSILIPAGSKLVGEYESLRRQGDTRLGIKWRRILRPDGAHVVLEAPAADIMGRTGLVGDLDGREVERFFGAALTSLVPAIAAGFAGLSQRGQTEAFDLRTGTVIRSTNSDAGSAALGAAAQQFGTSMSQFTNQLIRENFDVAPVLTVPQGTRLMVMPMADLYFAEPDSSGNSVASPMENGPVQRREPPALGGKARQRPQQQGQPQGAGQPAGGQQGGVDPYYQQGYGQQMYGTPQAPGGAYPPAPPVAAR